MKSKSTNEKKAKAEVPPEGWWRCADCESKVYEDFVYALNDETSSKKKKELETVLEEREKCIKKCLMRHRVNTQFKPNEHRCICCHYESEYKDEIEKGKLSVIKTFTDFKRLCKEYNKKYKNVRKLPISNSGKSNGEGTGDSEED